ncbi:hypothetical protein [Chitinimonas sp.]|uniref:hypothetical protein n=1 Tax=Chitinimonas sp. TaxID=1934313 RepID=UPI002F92156F
MARDDVPVEISDCAGSLAVADGVILLTGHHGAALCDGKQWTRLFSLTNLSIQK